MSKTTRETLANELQTELVAYLKAGDPINDTELTQALDFTGLSIRDFNRLKRIRFALSSDVTDYLDKLGPRLRRIRTESEVEREETRGEIRGAVDWGQTLRARYAQNANDRSLFVTRLPYTEYQIPENKLLKTLLSIIYRTAKDELLSIDQKWRRELWSTPDIQQFIRLYERNIHLDRIDADETTRLPPKALNAARRSRQRLYTEAYELYVLYDRLQNNDFSDSDTVEALLFETLALPSADTLFELVCLFRLARILRREFRLTVNPIERGMDAILQLENDRWLVRLYHDQTGPLQFYETIPDEPQDQYLQRYRRVLVGHREFMNRESLRHLYRGRPDVLVEVCEQSDPQTPVKIVIGEAKHSTSQEKLSEGVLELWKYLTFARPAAKAERSWPDTKYLLDINAQSFSLSGIVFTDGAAPAATEKGEQLNDQLVAHLPAGDIADAQTVERLLLPYRRAIRPVR